MKSSITRFVLIVLLWLPLLAVAQQRSNSSVEDYARRIWSANTADVGECAIISTPLDVDDMPCYVVVRTDKTRKDVLPGYMLITAVDDCPTLLAYDRDAHFSTQDLPPHIRSWIKGYESMLSNNTQEEVRNWMKASQSNHDDVLPLLGNREWGQDNPYNLFCPAIDGKHCPTGCVATALAQIMCHHKWPLSGTGSISYKTSSNKLNVSYDFSSTTFEWDKMLDTYIPLEDLVSEGDKVLTDRKYYLNSIAEDNNSVPFSKCYVNITGLTVIGSSSFDGEIVLLATDNDGNFVTRVSSSMSRKAIMSGKILDGKSFLLYVPSSLSDGTYRIYCGARARGVSEWSLSNSRAKDNYITLSKEGNSFSVGNDTYPCCPSSEEVTPVSTLLQAVGAAVRMDYGLSGSGSNDANTLEGTVAYLGYDTDMFFAYPNVYTDEQWHETLQQELVEGRPVYYTGQGLDSGHAFVIDGFQKADDGTIYYHVNWGWDGLCNGYYLLNMLRPSSAGTGGSTGSNYANQPSMLVGMKPEDGVSSMKMNCGGVDLLADEYFAGGFFPICIRTLSLQTSKDFTGELRLELLNEDASKEPITLYNAKNTITSKRGLTNYYISSQIPADVPGGNYTLQIVCLKEDGENVEIKCQGWPQIKIKGLEEWNGGPMAQPLQKLAVGGELSTEVKLRDGVVTLSADSIVNPMPQSTSGQLALLLCDSEGRVLAEPHTTVSLSVSGYGVKRRISVSSPISRNMPDGIYGLYIGYLPQNDSLWTVCDRITCYDNIWWAVYTPSIIPMSITDGLVQITGFPEFQGADIPWTMGIKEIERNVCVEPTLYDLSGRQSAMSRKGVYIVKSKNRVVKILK